MERWFFDSWDGLLRVLVVGVLAYTLLVAIVRVSGKRALARMNAFDLIVTVALGSVLATVVLSKDVALVEGAATFGMLIGLQFVVSWLSVRSAAVRRMVKAEPTLLARRGELLTGAMRRERVTEGEVLAAVRAEGLASLDETEGVVLETDGTISVIAGGRGDAASAMMPLDEWTRR